MQRERENGDSYRFAEIIGKKKEKREREREREKKERKRGKNALPSLYPSRLADDVRFHRHRRLMQL